METIRRTKQRLREVLKALHITGPFNIQFLAKENHIKIIELNVRASRSFPFVSKSLKLNFAEIATLAMLGKNVDIDFKRFDLDYVTVKAPQFSYSRIKKTDPILYVEMGSTGEVATFGHGYQEAVLKSMLAAGYTFPKRSILLSIGNDAEKARLLPFIQRLADKKYVLYATEGTSDYLTKQGISNTKVLKVSTAKRSRESKTVLSYIESGEIDLIINIPRNYTRQELSDGYYIRRTAVDYHVPLISNPQIAKIFINAISNLTVDDLEVRAWSEY